MKKLVLLSAFLLFSQNAFASDVCIEKVSYGLSPDGVCENFATPCEIPTDWKQVPSCKLIEQGETKKSMEDKLNQRYYKQNRAYAKLKLKNSQKKNEAIETNTKYKRQGRGYLTRTGKYRRTRLSTKNKTDYSKRRTVTRKDYSKATREKIKKLNIQKGGYQHEDDVTKEERLERRTSRPKIQRGTRMRRSGYLSNQPKFSTSIKERSAAKTIGSKRTWKSIRQTSRKRQASKNRTIQLRKTFRGNRLEGDLEDGSLE